MKPFFACLILAVGLMTGTVEVQAAQMIGMGGEFLRKLDGVAPRYLGCTF